MKKVVEFPEILNIHDPVMIFFSLSAGLAPVYLNGQTILSKASQMGLLRMIEMCQSFNLKDQKDVYGFYATSHAKNYATLTLLVRLGYSTDGVLDVIITKWTQTELMKAVDLIGNNCTNKSIIHAVSRNFGSLIQKFNILDGCLHESVKSSTTFKLTQYLVSRCDVNSLGSYGLTPLHIAVKMKNTKAVQLLVQYGADLMIKTSCGKTARELCCKEMLPYLKI